MIKLVCSDIDNTLGRSGAEGSAILRKLKEKGILPMLATGRSVADIFELYPEARENTVVASYDGAIVSVGGTVLFRRPIDPNIVNAFFDSFPKSGLSGGSLIFYTADGAYVTDESAEKALNNADTMRGRIARIAGPAEIPSEVYKISVYSDPAGDYDYLFSDWENYLSCVCKKGRWCEFVSAGTDKGFALNLVMEKFMLKSDEVMAFGDGENDFTMLEAAGCSYAVEGSAAHREEKADFVTRDVARTINELLLKN